ncbi:fibronectin type III domain-containing protein [Paenibacillus cymbidii]|uniref:fibronectin type III domain-containing protein n=1 Tax=Paenibacillus cymbidii TaxID=1639034 RepID=UPI001081F971|nr:fibronectin type III domain-containing protein [Paenibacillus cymbidii]
MNRKMALWAGCFVFFACFGVMLATGGNSVYASPVKITLSPSMVTNTSALGDPTLLVDEQTTAGDPAGGSGGNPTNGWHGGWNTADYPLTAYIDLGQYYDLTDIYLYDSTGTGSFTVSSGSPGSWTQLFVDSLNTYNHWSAHSVSATTRYIGVAMGTPNSWVRELVVYGTPSGDTTPPAAVSDLAAASSTASTVTLTWTAPGDDNNTGTAASYDVRYSTSPINAGNWASAAQATGEPTPAAAGTGQTMTVGGLVSGTTYYFAIKTADEVPNVSAISTLTASIATGADTIAPATVTNLQVVSVTSTTARLKWTAPGDDNTLGTATSYDLRYNTVPITAGNWGSSKQASFEPAPQAAGSDDYATVYGLNTSTLYYFALKTTDKASNISALSTGTVSYTTLAATSGTAIPLNPSMVINETARGDAGMLVDEQSDPRGGTPTTPTSIWDYGSGTFYLPISAVIDLGAEYALTDIYYFDGVGGGSSGFTFSSGSPLGWTAQFSDALNQTNKWVGRPFNVTTRYVQIYTGVSSQKVGEIVLYGTPVGTPAAPPTPVPHTKPTMNELMGVNTFYGDPVDKMAVVNNVREYHNWVWDEGALSFGTLQTGYAGQYPNNLNKFNGSYSTDSEIARNFDDFYDSIDSAGLQTLPAIQASVSWLTTALWDKPVSTGESATSPASYAEHADHMFQYAARYGSTAVADNKLKLAADQPRSTGMNLLSYIENANEPDKWWQNRSGYFTPYEFAAMTSADYDGHQGAMGNTVGVKNADPNMKMVMGGLANTNVDYIKAMKFWSDVNRGGSIPFDVINVHHYSNVTVSGVTVGISPEDDHLKDQLKSLVDYRDQYMHDQEVWLTEFGYDTHPASVQRAPAIAPKSQQDVQADWLVRSYLAAAAAGLDRAYAYYLTDVNSSDSTKYRSSGLIGQRGDWTPKVSWYYVYTLRNTLGNMRYLAEQSSGNSNVLVYKFKNATGTGGAYVVWCKTSNNTTVPGYSLSLAGSPTTASQVTLANGDTDGVTSALTIAGGSVTVNVGETPIFVLVNDMP